MSNNNNHQLNNQLRERPIKILPRNYSSCSKEDLITLINRLLISLIKINDRIPLPLNTNNLTRFHSRRPPAIDIHSYLTRLTRFSSLENAVLLLTIYYIDLLSSTYSSFSLNSLTVHRFLLIATTVGTKELCDQFSTNTHYAKVGGVQVNELNMLEMEFLTRVDWRIVPISNFQKKYSTLSNPNDFMVDFNLIDSKSDGDLLDLYYKQMIELVGESEDEASRNWIYVEEQEQEQHQLVSDQTQNQVRNSQSLKHSSSSNNETKINSNKSSSSTNNHHETENKQQKSKSISKQAPDQEQQQQHSHQHNLHKHSRKQIHTPKQKHYHSISFDKPSPQVSPLKRPASQTELFRRTSKGRRPT